MAIRKTQSAVKAPKHAAVTRGNPAQKSRPRMVKSPVAGRTGADAYSQTSVKRTEEQLPAGAARVDHAWASPVRQASMQFGANLRGAGALLVKGGDQLSATEPIGLEATSLGSQAHGLGAHVESYADAAYLPAAALAQDAQTLHGRAQSLATLAEEQASKRNLAGRAVDSIREGAHALGSAVRQYAQDIVQAVDYEKNIDLLGPSDSYTLSGYLFLMGGVIELEGAAAITVARVGDRYSVSIDGEAAAGLFAAWGFKVMNVGAVAFASATAGGGQRVELSFSSADEAKAAVRLMLRRVAKSVTHRSLTDEEAGVLKRNLTAYEVRTHNALEGWGLLGASGPLSLASDVVAKKSHKVRVEFGDHPTLVVGETYSADMWAKAAASRATPTTTGRFYFGGGKGFARVELERRFGLPTSVDPSRSSELDLTQLKKQTEGQKPEESVKVTLEAQGGLLGNGGGVGVHLNLGAEIEQVATGGVASAVLTGNLQKALERLPPETHVESDLQHFSTHGININPVAFFMGFGGGTELEASRRDVDPEGIQATSGTAAQVASTLKDWELSEAAKR